MFGIIIQARMTSTRLPGKVLKPFQDNSTILGRLCKNLKLLNLPMIIATSTNPDDDRIVEFCKKNKIQYFRGEEQNVLKRFLDAGKLLKCEYFIRICADNPFFQIHSLEPLMEVLKKNKHLDYVSYKNNAGLPAIKTHWGLFGEIVSFKSLLKAYHLTNETLFLEHVTNFIYGNLDIFNVCLLKAPTEIINREDVRFTVDNQEDFENAQEILKHIGDDYTLTNLLEIVKHNQILSKKMIKNINKYSK